MSAAPRSRAHRRQRRELVRRQRRPRWVVRADGKHRAYIFGPHPRHILRRKRPAAVVVEAVRDCRDAVERRQVIEERVARHGHQHGIAAWSAQQLEEQRIGLARARREDEAVGIDLEAAAREVTGHGAAGAEQAERLRLVLERLCVGEGAQCRRRVVQSNSRGVRCGQIDEPAAVRPRAPHGLRDAIRLKAARYAAGKHRS